MEKFIREAFEKIQRSFPNTKLCYQYNDYSSTHFVKVTPSSTYDKDRFIDLESELTEQFSDVNTVESLCFITEGALVTLDSPSITFEPKNGGGDNFYTYGHLLEQRLDGSIDNEKNSLLSFKYSVFLEEIALTTATDAKNEIYFSNWIDSPSIDDSKLTINVSEALDSIEESFEITTYKFAMAA